MSEASVAAMLLPELLDIVFENLQASRCESRCANGDDPDWPAVTQARKQLNACTLVSRLWYHIAHRHLFRDLVYSFQNPPAEGVATWSNWGTSENPRWASPPLIVARSSTDSLNIWRFDRLPLKTLQMFSDFLEQSPHTRSSVRSLRLVMYPGFTETDWPLTIAGPPEARDMIDPVLLLSFMSGLPQLEYLQTWNILVALPRTPDTLIPPISVRELGVVNNFFTVDSQTIYNLMTYFGHIDRLTFYRPRWTNSTTITEKSHPSIPLNVRTLNTYLAMNEISLIIISQLLRRSSFRGNLNRLTLDNVGRWGVAGVAVLIHDLGPQLEYFNLTIYADFNAELLDLSMMGQLEELVIGTYVPVWGRMSCGRDSMRYLSTAMLSPQKNPKLRKISFHYDADEGDDKDDTTKWWDAPAIRAHIKDFEVHFAHILRTFKFDGMFFDCPHEGPETRDSYLRIKETLPQIFRHLSQQHLFIFAD